MLKIFALNVAEQAHRHIEDKGRASSSEAVNVSKLEVTAIDRSPVVVVLDGSHGSGIGNGDIDDHLAHHNSSIGEHADVIEGGLEDKLLVAASIAAGKPVNKGLFLMAAGLRLAAWVDDAGAGIGAGEGPDTIVVAGLDLGVELGLELQDGLATLGRSTVGGFAAGSTGAAAGVASTATMMVVAGAAGSTASTSMPGR